MDETRPVGGFTNPLLSEAVKDKKKKVRFLCQLKILIFRPLLDHLVVCTFRYRAISSFELWDTLTTLLSPLPFSSMYRKLK